MLVAVTLIQGSSLWSGLSLAKTSTGSLTVLASLLLGVAPWPGLQGAG